jgi:hypothetical protein
MNDRASGRGRPFRAASARCGVMIGSGDAHPVFGDWRPPSQCREAYLLPRLFGEPHLDQRLVRHVALMGGDLDRLKQAHGQPQ